MTSVRGVHRHRPDLGAFETARAEFKGYSLDQLEWAADALQEELATIPDRWVDIADDSVRQHTVDLDRFATSERVRAATTERELRTRSQNRMPAARDRRVEDWADLARVVRERVGVEDVLAMAGVPLAKAGRDSRGGGDELCGPCPVCGDGFDRLRVWTRPANRVWCRQCGWSADVIAVAQSLFPACAGFRSTVRYLAETCLIRSDKPA